MVIFSPQSTPAGFCLPIRQRFFWALLVGAVAPLAGQGNDRMVTDADFVNQPGGAVLARLERGAAITFGASRGTWREATLEGWLPTSALRADRRDGFDVAINLSAGAPIRATNAGDAAVRGVGRAGALFNRVETRGTWVRVKRQGWVPRSATEAAAAPVVAQPTTPAAVTPAPVGRTDTSRVVLQGGTVLATQPGGTPAGELETGFRGQVVERRDGWTKVRIEAWVRDAAAGLDAAPDQITAQDIRSSPDKYVGQTVEWTLQVLAVQSADELRPELPLGQPYVLARGPLPESGFVYLVVTAAEAAQFRALEPLAEIRVRATVRSGRTRFLPTPVLNLVRRLS
jgi:hypothetical protein